RPGPAMPLAHQRRLPERNGTTLRFAGDDPVSFEGRRFTIISKIQCRTSSLERAGTFAGGIIGAGATISHSRLAHSCRSGRLPKCSRANHPLSEEEVKNT